MYDQRFAHLRRSVQPRALSQQPLVSRRIITNRWQPLTRPYDTPESQFHSAETKIQSVATAALDSTVSDSFSQISLTSENDKKWLQPRFHLPSIQFGTQGKMGLRWILLVSGFFISIVVVIGVLVAYRYASSWFSRQRVDQSPTDWMVNNIETFTLPSDQPVLLEASAAADLTDEQLESVTKGGDVLPSPLPTLTPIARSTTTVPVRWEEHQFVNERFSLFTPPDYSGSSVKDVSTKIVTIFLKPKRSGEPSVALRIQPDWSGTGVSESTPRTFVVTSEISAVKSIGSLTQPEDQQFSRYIFPYSGRVYVFSCQHDQRTEQEAVCEQIVQSFRPW